MKKKNIKLFGILVIVLFILLIIINYFNSKNITEIEKISITNISNNVVNYIDDIGETSSLDKYILYAIKYNYNENNKDTISSKEISNIINNTFNKNVSESDIIQTGISPEILDNNVTYDINTDEFKIDMSSLTMKEISQKEISIYKNIKNYKKGNKYYSVYEKYLIKNPYDILNYYNDLNSTSEEYTNIDKINEYLEGSATEKELKEYVNDDILKKYGELSDKVTVELITSNNKILVNSIK